MVKIPMGNSLQDQLLKAGLVSEQRAKQVRSSKRKQNKRAGGKEKPDHETRRRAQQAAAEKTRRDSALNRQQQEAMRRKAEANELRQLIHTNRIPRGEGDIAYSFVAGNSVKRLYVTSDQQRMLADGRLAIVRQDTAFELVAPEIAEKVLAYDKQLVVLLNKPKNGDDQDDDYAGYEVPEDLIW